ncbi:helix-turn-helix domain-containing protein [Actinomadura vinacea]|uniref:Helix-turn-helix domain-containing protein n=1 Tax=Actinomadura vinacea TaxID=115336 RepID=A0ABN3JQQ3_9ACTN
MTHRVAVLLVPPVVAFDSAIPGLVLGCAKTGGRPHYEVRTCTPRPGPVATTTDVEIMVRHGLEILDEADTIVVPGTHGWEAADPRVAEALRGAAADGRRLVSICTGAFMLGLAGVLDGRRATTYWRWTDEFARRFPSVDLDPRVLFVDDGPVLTSAGLAAGIDLCLHIVRSDFGAAVANEVARHVVMAPGRQGGQAQFIAAPPPAGDGAQSLAVTREWALRNLDRPLTLTDLAGHARVSIRTLTRRFGLETGMAPLQWLLHSRVERAKELLESTALPVAEVARLSGLGSADSLRAHLVRRAGLTPTAYRAAFSEPARP